LVAPLIFIYSSNRSLMFLFVLFVSISLILSFRYCLLSFLKCLLASCLTVFRLSSFISLGFRNHWNLTCFLPSVLLQFIIT
jgi:hypothetical protein